MIKILFAVVLIVFLIAIGPILTMWALNTLFPVLAIPFDVYTWAAVVILGVFMRGEVSAKK